MIILRFCYLSFFICLFFNSTVAQEPQHTPGSDSLRIFFMKLAGSKNDNEKDSINKSAMQLMSLLLQDEKNYFLFDSVPHLGKLISPDKKLRIYNWNLVRDDGQFEYFAFLLHYDNQDRKFKVFSLTDRSKFITGACDATLGSQTWFGALYYQIIESKAWGKKYYTLLGWDGYNDLKNRKIIEVLTFNKDGDPKFGAQIFSRGNFDGARRIIFEFANRASMALSYDKNTDMIVFDNLSPSNSTLTGQFQYYGPDGSYNGFELKRGKWSYMEDIDARNPKARVKKKKRSDNF